MSLAHRPKRAKKSGLARKSSHPRSYVANLANMKLLVGHQEFQAIVAETRKKLRVPEGGIKSDKELSLWTDAYIKASDAVNETPEYRARGRAIVEEYRTGKIDREEFNRRINLHHEEIPINYRWGRARFIADKFGLPENYAEHVDTYIIQGRITAPYHNFVLGPWGELRHDENFSTVRRIPVTFYTMPTNEDVRLVKEEVERFAKRRGLPRYNTLKDIDRNLDIEEWHRQKERFDPVEQTTYRTTAAEIAEEYLGSAKKAGGVRAIGRDLKKIREKRFRPREKK
jgi:hypothetical protein